MRPLSADILVEDLCAVADDVDALAKATAGNVSQAFLHARAQIENSLQAAKQNLERAQRCASKKTEGVARRARAYMQDNAWTSMGIAAALGFVFGAIATSKRGRKP
jgi:ElaB/YqjD/DUF883 family membrane-anchored ribosome-binding protein